jgi:hypothetical protein
VANFYASRDFLDAAAAVWFKHRKTAVENVQIGNDVLRLLVVDDRRIVTKLLFLDFHQPLAPAEVQGPVRKGRHARNVVRRVIGCRDWLSGAFPENELAPFVDWSAFQSFAAYKEELLKRHRGFIRDRERRGRSLATNHGKLVFTRDDRANDVLPLARQWKSAQLRATGQPDYFALPETMEFLEALRERNLLVSSTLRAGGRLVSLWIGFIYQGSWSGWIFAYDPAFKKYAAGHQLLDAMLEESFRLGHREFDFSEGGEDYKMIYATHGRVLGEIGAPPPIRAAVLFAKRALRERSPKLLAAVQGLKRGLGSSLVRTRAAFSPLQRAGEGGS